MKARVKATGDIAEVSLSHIVYDGGKKIMWYNTLQGASFTGDELEFIDPEENFDYWTRLEHQYAGMAMNALLLTNNIRNGDLEGMRECNTNAMAIAYAFVEKLKEKEEK